MLRKLLSYIIPIKIYKTKSTLSKTIEVTWANGELVLDSEKHQLFLWQLATHIKKRFETLWI